MPQPKKTIPVISDRIKSFLLIALMILAAVALWFSLQNTELYSSVLRTSLNRLTSTPLEFTIASPGELHIEAGPSSFMEDARVMAMVLDTGSATPTDEDTPFEVGGAFQTILNMTNPSNPNEVILVVLFPEGHFTDQKRFVGRLPFGTTQEGYFELKNILIGSLPLL